MAIHFDAGAVWKEIGGNPAKKPSDAAQILVALEKEKKSKELIVKLIKIEPFMKQVHENSNLRLIWRTTMLRNFSAQWEGVYRNAAKDSSEQEFLALLRNWAPPEVSQEMIPFARNKEIFTLL